MSNKTNAKRFGKVAVLLGGKSAEREISLKSGDAVLRACLSQGIDAHAVDARDNPLQKISDAKFDRVFIALHGRGGEDGSMQGALEILGVPYTGSGVMASAIGMDKLRTKLVWSALGLSSPKFAMLNANTDFNSVVQDYGLPLMVKPAHEGSSVGMTKVKQADQLQVAWQAAAKYDAEVFAEQWITGKEYTCAILGDQALPMIRLETPNEFYDYDAKYIANTTQYHCPCGLDAQTEANFQQLAKRAFDGVGCKGWGRVDLLTDSSGEPYLIEVNTIPGLTDHSLVPMAAKQAGISFEQLVVKILEQTL